MFLNTLVGIKKGGHNCAEGDKIVSAPYLFKAELLRKVDEAIATS